MKNLIRKSAPIETLAPSLKPQSKTSTPSSNAPLKGFDPVFNNMTELKSNEAKSHQDLQDKIAELAGITSYLNGILDHIVQGILFIDHKGTITTYNKAAEMILNLPHQQILFSRFWDHFKDDVFGFSISEALQKKQKHSSFSCSYQHRELEVVTTFVDEPIHEASTLPMITPHSIGKQGMIVMLQDVTEIRHLHTLTNRSSRMKALGEMASHVAHEIRNPLGGIKGFASLLQRDLSSMPHLQKMANYIVEGTEELNRLVNQVLHYTRTIHLKLEKIDLISLLNEMKQHVLADTSISQQAVEITINSPYKEIELLLDVTLFKTALLNLIVNAIQAMPKGGKITINVQKQHHHLLIIITDTGIGISEENLAKLYSPFFTTKADGNGLGLAEVQKIVQAHEGTIDVSSIVDLGTTFIIKLPLQR